MSVSGAIHKRQKEMDNLPPDAPQPRHCHVAKRPDFQGYGFNLHAEKARPGQFIGKVDADSPAEDAGLHEGDRIVEVNGVNISQENHKQVVQRIKAIPNETRLLVVDKSTDDYYKKLGIIIRSSMPNVLEKSSTNTTILSSSSPISLTKNSEINGNLDNSSAEAIVEIAPPPFVPTINDNENQVNHEIENTVENASPRSSKSSTASMEKKPMSVSSDDGSSPRTTPSPTTLERSDSDRTDWDGLNLSLTAREMRERIGSKKKADPRKDKLDMRKKFDIIQTL